MNWLKLLLLLGSLSLVSCLEAEIHSPDDMIADLCRGGSYGQTLIRCINSDGQLQSQLRNPINLESRALFVFIEPGDYASNAALRDEALKAVATGIDTKFRPLLRQVMINLVVGHQKMLIDQVGKKYDVIYYARTNQRWSATGLLKAMENVVRNHSTVDMLLAVHGSRSALTINSDLQTRVTDVDFSTLQSRLSPEARGRVRSIFMTACYAGQRAFGADFSIAEKLVSIFPKAIAYGSQGVNYGPVHRDLMAFEYYYRNWTFTSAIDLGNRVLSTKIKDGTPRTELSMPVLSVMGQGRFAGFKKSSRELIKIPALKLNPYVIQLAKAQVFRNQTWDSSIVSLNANKATDALSLVYFPK